MKMLVGMVTTILEIVARNMVTVKWYLSQNNCCWGRDSNLAHPEYKETYCESEYRCLRRQQT
jgi:hypothetical protein